MTTYDLMKKAEAMKAEAKHVTNEREHAEWWDEKVELLEMINSCLETGFYTGEARDELLHAKHLLSTAELYAGQYAINVK